MPIVERRKPPAICALAENRRLEIQAPEINHSTLILLDILAQLMVRLTGFTRSVRKGHLEWTSPHADECPHSCSAVNRTRFSPFVFPRTFVS